MNSGLLLSVIIPVYNIAKWLPRCIDSVLAQTYENIEILLIDDGSTDDSPAIVDDYAKKYSRIKAIHQENRGLAATRERGILEAAGEFVGFVDGDDEITPEMFEKLMYNAVQYNAQISQCGILCCYPDGREVPLHGTGKLIVYNRIDGCEALLDGTQMEPSMCNKIYYAPLLINSCLDQTIINNEDMLRNIVLFNRATCSVLEDFCGYIYRRRPESMSFHRNSVEIVKNVISARKAIVQYVPRDLKDAAIRNYTDGAIRGYNILLKDHSKEANEMRIECKDILRDYGFKSRKQSLKERIRSIMILYLTPLYDFIENKHNRHKRKIHQSKKS